METLLKAEGPRHERRVAYEVYTAALAHVDAR